MSYIIFQKSGKLADAAKSLFEARKAGDLDKMVEIYRQATGDQREIGNEYGKLNPATDIWWTFNAADVVRGAHGLTIEEYHKACRNCKTEQARAQAICEAAQRKVGGTWEYEYEY